jgi:NitT/TauT family transport system substrate-binding protein
MIKKLFILIFTMFLVGCTKTDAITMMVPFGNPQLSQLNMQDSKTYNVDIVIGADPLVAAFGSASHDVIFAPINLGARFYQSKDDYTLLGVVTWGNYFLISERELSLETIKDQTIVVFGRNQVSDILMKVINDYYQLNLTFEYVDSLPSATAEVLLNPQKIVLVSDPSYTQLLLSHPSFHGLELHELYQNASSDNVLPQAGVFVHKSLNNQQKNQIKTDIETSISRLSTHQEEMINLAKTHGMTWSNEVLISVFTSNQITFVSSLEAKPSIEAFFQHILNYQPQLINNELPDDAFYGG